MPIPAIPALVAGTQIATSGINAVSQAIMNKKNQKWQEKMYQTQRNDALADWRMQNDYNSPQAQMQRLSSAGLNPNLVYGEGATAMSSQGPRSSSPGSWNPKAPEISFDANSVLSSYYDIEIKKQQANNLKNAK